MSSSDTTKPEQPDLLDPVWLMPFYGRAETNGCGLWWYERDGKRHPLLSAHAEVGSTLKETNDGQP